MGNQGEVKEIESQEAEEPLVKPSRSGIPMQTITAPPEKTPKVPVDRAPTDGVQKLPRFFENEAYAFVHILD